MLDSSTMISIVIPTFNRENLISETLESVMGQSYSNWECIVVDDGSTDNTLRVLRNYAEKDARIKIFKRNIEPKGANKCRNIGIENSNGKYLIFLDSDDLLGKNCLENRLGFAIKNENNCFYIFGVASFKNSIHNLKHIYPKPPKEVKENVKLFLQYENTWSISAVMWEKSYLLQVKGFNETFQRYQDIEFHLRVLALNSRFKISDDFKPDAFYRIGDEAVKKWKNRTFLNIVAQESIRLLYFNNKMFSLQYRSSIRSGYLKILKNYFLKQQIKKRYERIYLSQGLKYTYINRCNILQYVILKLMRKLNLHNKKYTSYYRWEAKLFNNKK